MEKIHVSLADYDANGTFSKFVAVAMASVADNATNPVCFHILHDETLSQENKDKLCWTLDNIGNKHGLSLEHEIDFVDVSDIFKRCGKELDDLCWVFSRGSIFYFTLPDVLPNVDKIIKLDSDTVTMLDITELWNFEIGDYCVAAVPENRNFAVPGIKKKLDIYYNAGISILNLKKIREDVGAKKTLFGNALKYFKECSPKLPDQDFLNYQFVGKFCDLEKRFNARERKKNEYDLTEQNIWHFGKVLSGIKGWGAEVLYWKYLYRSAWKDELVDLFYAAAMDNAFVHRHSQDCIKRLADTASHEIMKGIKKLLPFKH